MDKRVEVYGAGRADVNGTRSVVADFHWYEDGEGEWRYKVQLDGGEAFKVKPTSVRGAGGRGDGGGAGKGKGKGKERCKERKHGVHGHVQ